MQFDNRPSPRFPQVPKGVSAHEAAGTEAVRASEALALQASTVAHSPQATIAPIDSPRERRAARTLAVQQVHVLLEGTGRLG